MLNGFVIKIAITNKNKVSTFDIFNNESIK
nr:MAG TPA: hypothetical protein [Caudoviricetes sp.]